MVPTAKVVMEPHGQAWEVLTFPEPMRMVWKIPYGGGGGGLHHCEICTLSDRQIHASCQQHILISIPGRFWGR